jgi:hypothetical protein
MTNQQQETIVIECRRLALILKSNCAAWLHTPTNKRPESASFELSGAADALYTFINNNPEIMGSDTGKPAFDEYNKEPDEDFQTDMQNLWDND